MMSIRWITTAMLAAALAACSLTSHSISGAYLAPSTQSVELLQLTQASDGQLLGSLQHYEIKADGTPLQETLNVSGSVDGKALTLIFKPNEPLSSAVNVSGTVDGAAITLNWANYSERFVVSTPDAYRAAVVQLSAKGQAVQQNIAQTQRVEDENAAVLALTGELNSYSAAIEGKSDRLSSVHKDQADMVDAARKDLDIEARLKAGSGYQQGQGGVVQARIGQLHANLVQMNMIVLTGVNSGRQTIKDFDARLASSSCKILVNKANVSECAGLTAAEKRYLAVRANVLNEIDEAQASVDESSAAMVLINKQAGNY